MPHRFRSVPRPGQTQAWRERDANWNRRYRRPVLTRSGGLSTPLVSIALVSRETLAVRAAKSFAVPCPAATRASRFLSLVSIPEILCETLCSILSISSLSAKTAARDDGGAFSGLPATAACPRFLSSKLESALSRRYRWSSPVLNSIETNAIAIQILPHIFWRRISSW